MFDGLIKIIEVILGRSDKLREIDADRRKRLSVYFDNVSRCLSDIATALRSGAEPWGPCEELRGYNRGKNIWGLIAAVFDEDLATELQIQLNDLTSIREIALHKLIEIRHRTPRSIILCSSEASRQKGQKGIRRINTENRPSRRTL